MSECSNISGIDEFEGMTNITPDIDQSIFVPPTENDNANYREMQTILTSHGIRVVKGDDNYNLIDQHHRIKWSLTGNHLQRFYELCEKLRVDEIDHGFSTRQGDESKLWFDMDIKLETNSIISDNETIHTNIANSLITQIVDNGVFANEDVYDIHVLITHRKSTTHDQSSGFYKDGIHVYTTINTSMQYRYYITKKIAESDIVKTSFPRRFKSLIKNIDTMIDIGSARVMPLIIGATKFGGTPYVFGSLFKYSMVKKEIDEITKITADDIDIIGMFTPAYTSNKHVNNIFNLKIAPHLENEFNSKQFLKCDEGDDEDENNSISILSMNDPNVREISMLINLLAKTRSDDYSSWKKIINVLAGFGDKYKSIAKTFSKRWDKFDKHNFETDWKGALVETKKNDYGIAVIKNMARQDDPDEYKKITSDMIISHALKSIFEVISFQSAKSARLGDFHIADIIHKAFPDKYIATPKCVYGGHKLADDSDVIYWVYSTKNSDIYIDGNACKYVAIQSLAPLNVWLSKSFTIILRELKKFLHNKMQDPATTETMSVKYGIGMAIIGKAHQDINSDSKKNSILRQFAQISTKFGFAEKMDTAKYVMGVYDALIETGIDPKIISGLSDHKISMSAPSKYILFDPHEDKIIKVAQIYLDFCPISEFDAMCFILLLQSQSLSKAKKDLILLNLWGHGRNGKSVIGDFPQNALGDVSDRGYAAKFNMSLLTAKNNNSSGARPDLIPLAKCNYASSSEAGKLDRIFPENLKQILSGEKTAFRGLYKEQKSTEINTVLIVGTNDPLEFNLQSNGIRAYDIDYGSSRRLKIYKAKHTYKEDPDPSNNLEKQNDADIIGKIVPSAEYGGALLSLFSVVHALFIMIHDEHITNVVSPNIEKESEIHIDKMDVISKFIKETCVKTDKEYEIQLDSLIDSFIVWYDSNCPTTRHIRDKIANAFVMSIINKNIFQKDNKYWLSGIRCITGDEDRRDGEEFVCNNSKFKFDNYADYKPCKGVKLPFDNKIKPTSDAREFLNRLSELHKEYLSKK